MDYKYYDMRDIDYPKEENFVNNYFYKAGEVVSKEEVAHAISGALKLTKENLDDPKYMLNSYTLSAMEEAGYVMQTTVDKKAFNAAIAEYYQEESKRAAEFKTVLFEEQGLPDEISEIIYEEAFNKGHSHGCASIDSAFTELAGLARKVIDKTIEISLRQQEKV